MVSDSGMRGSIAITGLRTFLGQQLLHRIGARQPERRLVGVDLRRPHRLPAPSRFARVDLTEPTADGRLAEIFERERVETVIHTRCSASTCT